MKNQPAGANPRVSNGRRDCDRRRSNALLQDWGVDAADELADASSLVLQGQVFDPRGIVTRLADFGCATW